FIVIFMITCIFLKYQETVVNNGKDGKGWRITGHDLSTFVESNGDDGSCSGIRPIVHAVAIYRA
ncbi:MAG TPA: hypothetical protein PK223_01240, partial [Bacillota bacterium]|nr:hypothetical protein [Bacillota bacterium]